MKKTTPLEPRNSCKVYVSENGGRALLTTKEIFNQLAREKKFADGPYEEAQPGERQRQAFGKLKDRETIIYCELHKVLQRRAEEEITTAKVAEERRATQDRKSVTDVAIELLVDDDILAPYPIKTKRNGEGYIELGYKFTSKDAETFARRLAMGGGVV